MDTIAEILEKRLPPEYAKASLFSKHHEAIRRLEKLSEYVEKLESVIYANTYTADCVPGVYCSIREEYPLDDDDGVLEALHNRLSQPES